MSEKKKKADQTEAPITARKLIGFRVASILVIPALLLGGLEAGLRLVGYGSPTAAFLERKVGGESVCVPNARFTWRFFPRQIAREINEGLVFRAEKSPRTYRIFILGASAALGTPEPMHDFGRMMENMLNELYPQIRFEVINTAIVAINSHVVLQIAKDCAEYDPDLFIVYLGNNEVVGPYGSGTVLTPTPPTLGLIRANIAVKGTRIGQLFDGLLQAMTSRGRTPDVWGGMAMFLDRQVRYDARELQSVYHNFEKNLQDVCRIARRSGAPILISNVGVNLKDCPPFASLNADALTDTARSDWDRLYQEGVFHEAEGGTAQALACYMEAAGIDETHAGLQFRIGNCCWERGDFEKAGIHYRKALQFDTLRFRADAGINRVIRDVAENREDEGIYFVDSVSALEENSPHRLNGEELFFEHVHLNFTGKYILARTFVQAVDGLLNAKTEQKPEHIMGEAAVAARQAYTDFDRYESLNELFNGVLSRPPFTNQPYHEERMRAFETTMSRLKEQVDLEDCLLQYDQAIRENPDDWRLLMAQYNMRNTLRMTGDLQADERQLTRILTLCPYNHTACNALAVNLFKQGRFKEAGTLLHELLEVRPNSARAHYLLGRIASRNDDYAGAIRQYRMAVSIEPGLPIEVYGLLAQAYADNGNGTEAVRTLSDAIARFPEEGTAMAHYQLGRLLYEQGQADRALEEFDTAVRINPELAQMDDFQIQYQIIKGP